MNKMSLILGIVLLAAGAKARLGETVEQCRQRYGDPRRIELDGRLTGVATYTKNDLTIDIHYLNGKADLIRYSPGQVSRVDLDLAKYLLEVNGRTKVWDQLTKTEITLNEEIDENAQHARVVLVDPILWKSQDGILEASFSVGAGTFEARATTYQEKIRQGL